MRLPRWTVYPALAVLAAMLVLAFPHPQTDGHLGAAARARGTQEAATDGGLKLSERETVVPRSLPSEVDAESTD